MSYYSSGDVKNEILEPNVHNPSGAGARTEFKLQGDFFPSLKLLNLGRFGNNTVTPSDIAGQLGNIRRITLFDGKAIITEIREFNSVAAFENLKQSNQNNGDIERFSKRHNLGYQSRYLQDASKYRRKTIIKNDIGNARLLSATDADDATNRAYYDLREHFQMLQKVPILSDKVFKNLRLVIEYEPDTELARQKFQSLDNVATQNCRPLLAVDRIMNQKIAGDLLASVSNLSWMEVEHDTVLVPANAGGNGQQNVSRRIVGFNNKVVDKLRIRKNRADATKNVDTNAPVAFGFYNSLNMVDEKFQLEVNDRPIFPDFSLTGENRRLAHLVDTHGDLNLYENAHQNLVVIGYQASTLDATGNKAGTQDYFGTALANTLVRNLKLDYSRLAKTDGTADSKYQAQLELFISAEVQKNLIVGNGGYRITY
jgi:hypothetical protein